MTILSDIINTESGSASGGVKSIIAGTNIIIDDTDAQNPIISTSENELIFTGVSSGVITIGDFVIMNVDGTLSVIEQSINVNGNIGTEDDSGKLFNGTSELNPHIEKLRDDAWILVYYNNAADNWYGRVITDVEGILQTGPQYSLGSPSSSSLTGCTLDVLADNQFVFGYINHLFDGYTRYFTVSGTTITYHHGLLFNNSCYFHKIKRINDNQYLVAWGSLDTLTPSYVLVATVSNNTISYGAQYQFHTYRTGYISLGELVEGSKYIIAYRQINVSYLPNTLKVLTVSGTTISIGNYTEIPANSYCVGNVAFGSLTSSTMLIFHASHTGNGQTSWRAQVISVFGTTISLGTYSQFQYGATTSGNNNHIITFNENYGTMLYVCNSVGYSKGVSVSGTDITGFGTTRALTDGYSDYSASQALYDNDTIIAVGEFEGISYHRLSFPSSTSTNADDWIGVAQETVGDGESVDVLLPGATDDNQSSLTVDDEYFLTDAGALSITDNGRSVGFALSTTELLIQKDPVVVHNTATGRDSSNAHPISAITGLQTTLDTKLSTSYSPWEIGDVFETYRILDGTWLECNGDQYLNSAYPILSTMMTEGPSGSGYFVVPNKTGNYYIKAE